MNLTNEHEFRDAPYGRKVFNRDKNGVGRTAIFGPKNQLLHSRCDSEWGKDAQGEQVPRRTTGRGWAWAYDEQGRELSVRCTDGTGFDYTYDEHGAPLQAQFIRGLPNTETWA